MSAIYIKQLSSFGILDVRDYGARGDGTQDDSGPIQDALNACPRGGQVWLPPGYYRCDHNVVVPDYVTLIGSFRAGYSLGVQSVVSDPTTGGCVLGFNWAGNGTAITSTPFITLGSGSVVSDLAIYDPILGKSTNPRPFTIGTAYGTVANEYVGADTPQIRRVGIINCWQGIAMLGAVRWTIEDVYICALSRAVYVDQCADTSRLERVSVGPFYYLGPDNTTLFDFAGSNLTAYTFGRVDGLSMSNCMAVFCKTGILLQFSPLNTAPNAPWITGTNMAIDVCDIAIDCQASQDQGVIFTGGSLTTPPSSTNNLAVRVGAGNVNFGLHNYYVCSQSGQEVRLTAGNSSITGCTINSINHTTSGSSPSILATGGNAVVSGCTFTDARPPLSWQSSGSCAYGANLNLGGVPYSDPNSKVNH